ncbi:MAG: arsenic efflux protein [Planctomycetota bacterium]|nr:arsenic efflux protein [Planctomycetota bacterium]
MEYLHPLIECGEILYIVFGAMILSDYLNHLTAGRVLKILKGNLFAGYFVGIVLGILPGCAGSFVAVSLYTQGIISFGALTANMVATSGDESFVILAQSPDVFLKLNGILVVVAFVAGLVVDAVFKERARLCCKLPHASFQIPSDHSPDCFPFCSPSRIKVFHLGRIVIFVVSLFVVLIFTLYLGVEETEHYILLGVAVFLLFVSLSSSDTYFVEHILKHIVAKHLWKVMLWTLGILYALQFLLPIGEEGVRGLIKGLPGVAMLFAALVGIAPLSGPHLAVFFLFREGVLPFSVFLCNSIVQDGHAMLPMFAHSLKDSLLVKAFNIAFGLVVGYLFLLFGY